MISEKELKKLISLRKELHSNPELSNREEKTSKRIVDYLSQYSPDEIIRNIGGTGIAAVFNGEKEGPAILFRCELDALPIKEINDFDYRSDKDNISHKCGHDGHMAVVAGLAPILSQQRLSKGKVTLLFQPAEETGEGAERVLKDEKFKEIKSDFVFAFHNLPGYELNTILVKDENFASASKGMIVKLKGKTSHAAEPENGINPANVISKIINRFNTLVKNESSIKDFALITIIHIRLGAKAFGTSPGEAEVMATLRSYRNDDMDLITCKAESIIKEICKDENLEFEISYTEEFPATVNDGFCVSLIRGSAEKNGFRIQDIENPFRWSEDFGHFTNKHKGALFGIGSGINSPQLHNPDYDFPDEIIPTGIKMFYSITKKIIED